MNMHIDKKDYEPDLDEDGLSTTTEVLCGAKGIRWATTLSYVANISEYSPLNVCETCLLIHFSESQEE